MDAIWALLAVAVTGVTYDWRPIDESPAGESAAEYLVQVEPAVIEAVRNGGIEVIESNVPEGVGPIKRIRLVLGGSQSATELAVDAAGVPSGKQSQAAAARRRVAKPAVTKPGLAETAKRHTVKQQSSQQPLGQNFANGLNNAADQLEQGFQQASQGVQNGFNQVGQATADTRDAFTQPFNNQSFATQGAAAERKSIGSELLKGAGRLRENTRDALRNTGEAIEGTVRNVGDGLRSVVTGGAQGAPAPAAAGSGAYNPYSYNYATSNNGEAAYGNNQFQGAPNPSQPAFGANPVLNPPTQFQNQASGNGSFNGATAANQYQFKNQSQTTNNPNQFANDPRQTGGFNSSANQGFQQSQPIQQRPMGQHPSNQQSPGQQAPWNLQSDMTAGSSSYDPNRAYNQNQYERGNDEEQPYVPLVDTRRGSDMSSGRGSSDLVPVRPVGDNRDQFGQVSGNGQAGNQPGNQFGNGEFDDDWNAGGSGPIFPNNPSNAQGNQPSDFAGGGFASGGGSDPNSFVNWPTNPNQSNNQSPTNGAGQFATGAQPPAGAPLTAPQLQPLGAQGTPASGGQYTAVGANLPQLPEGEKPWGLFVLTSLACLGSLGGNLFLGWSYLDARNKYQSALRRTVRTFSRAD